MTLRIFLLTLLCFLLFGSAAWSQEDQGAEPDAAEESTLEGAESPGESPAEEDPAPQANAPATTADTSETMGVSGGTAEASEAAGTAEGLETEGEPSTETAQTEAREPEAASVAPAASSAEKPLHFGGFGGPLWRFGHLAGSYTPFAGGAGAWVINERFFLGGIGLGAVADSTRADVGGFSEAEVGLGYGGGLFGYVHKVDERVSVVVDFVVGAGGVSVVNAENPDESASDRVVVTEVGVHGVVELVDWIRLSAGPTYRWVAGSEIDGLSDEDLSGLGMGVMFQFGIW
jgi:hypothetical protein